MKPPRTTFVYFALRRLLKFNATKVLLASVFLWRTAYEFCRLRYWRDPHSAFFDGCNAYEWKYSLYREHEARRLIPVHNALSDPHVYVKDWIRANGALFFLTILFADTDPSRHPSWGQKWTDRLADKMGSYDVSEEEFSHLQELEKARSFREKGIFDYIYSLRTCTTTNASYLAILEEDIIIADGWMVKTLKALSDISLRSTQNPWIYLRLFYTETSVSWSSSDFAYRNMTSIFLIVQLVVLAGLLLRRLASGHPYLDYSTIGVICFISVPGFLGLT
ncbi:hypothetical protein P875_00095284 [Aspergillus parasiticus SU-1]|uniref:Uncharacterized protein n=1 Tax=Aspergillus parasiticus (strain ATCC 56775 / NRRL 5862 / SRRC 143 / SU-1) TaxID=1403190 RepID=A0A0F0I986_ASPPU|nr:hypothetical protein P875_00095284 [Aspergillus parasiticus SU-1]